MAISPPQPLPPQLSAPATPVATGLPEVEGAVSPLEPSGRMCRVTSKRIEVVTLYKPPKFDLNWMFHDFPFLSLFKHLHFFYSDVTFYVLLPFLGAILGHESRDFPALIIMAGGCGNSAAGN